MSNTINQQGIAQSLELVNQHLYSVEERISEQACKFDSAVEGYVAYAVKSKGKRLRPALALLAGGATGRISSGHIDLAVIVELIHVASLVHDDIIDGAEMRRDMPTASAKWGSAISVLLGDILFSHALELATGFHNTEISRRIATATTKVCSGEIIQTQRRFDLNLSLADYYRIIEMKTAALFAVASELGAFINEEKSEVITAFKTFGLKLGTAYQIYDDILDIVGSEDLAGKSLGTDLEKGKLTLPLIVALKKATAEEKSCISKLILDEGDDNAEETKEMVIRLGGLDTAIDATVRLAEEAEAELKLLSDTPYRQSLLGISAYLKGLVSSYHR